MMIIVMIIIIIVLVIIGVVVVIFIVAIMIMILNCSGFDVSRASWEFPEGTCAGYNGEKQSKFDDYDDDDVDVILGIINGVQCLLRIHPLGNQSPGNPSILNP